MFTHAAHLWNITSDADYEFQELESSYADPEERAKWRLRGGDDFGDYVLDLVDYYMPYE